MGALGRTDEVSQDLPSESLGFLPFTGYTDNIPPPSGTNNTRESNDSSVDSQKTVRTLSGKQVNQINQRKKQGQARELTASTTLGVAEIPADACADNFVGKVSASLDNLLSGATEGTGFFI